MTIEQNPFQHLGLAPTLDRARIKRAYFDALARTPPHREPEAFARLRAAYEQLMRPGGPEAASLSLPLDPEHDAAPYRERYGAALEAARQRQREQSASQAAAARFAQVARGSSLAELTRQLAAERKA